MHEDPPLPATRLLGRAVEILRRGRLIAPPLRPGALRRLAARIPGVLAGLSGDVHGLEEQNEWLNRIGV